MRMPIYVAERQTNFVSRIVFLGVRSQSLPALAPFFAVEDARPRFDQPRQHLKHRDGSPPVSLAGTVAAAVQLFRDSRVGAVLDRQLHDLEQHFALPWILFQVRAVPSDLQTEGNLRADCRLTGGLDRDLAFPLDRNRLPTFFQPALQILRPKLGRYHLAGALDVSHSPPLAFKETAALDRSTCGATRNCLDVIDESWVVEGDL